MEESGGGNRLIMCGSLILCALLAFLLRALPWRNFLGADGRYLFYGPDSYDHLRRIILGMTEFPRIPSFDSYYGYPVGTGQIWSPLFDYLISACVLLFHGDAQMVHRVGFWLPPALSFFTVFMVYAAGTRLFGRGAGFVAACIFALMPGHIIYSFVSELDHHVAEPMVCLALVLSLLKVVERQQKRRAQSFSALKTGGWMVFAILIWRGSVIFWGVAFLALAVQIVADRLQGRATDELANYGRNLCLFAALLLTPVCAFNLWGTSKGMSFGIVSWFHVTMLVCFAGLFVLLGRKYTAKVGNWPLVAAVVVVIFALVVPGTQRFVLELLSGLAVIGGKDPWLDSISELRPMLFPEGKFALWHVTETLSFLYWLFPVLLVLLFARWRRSGYGDFRFSLFMVWGSFFWLIPLFRERYVHLAALTTALGGGFLFCLLAERSAATYGKGWARCFAGVIMVILLAPVATFLWRIPEAGLPEYEKNDLMAALTWLREKTPATSFYHTPYQRPEYGVLADWELGAYIDYLARRPTVATNFGWETHGLFESAAFLTSQDPRDAEKILRHNGVRYVFLSQVAGNLPRLRAIAEFGVRKKNLHVSLPQPFKPLATMYYRLYVQDGSAYRVGGSSEQALGTYRLVYESANGSVDPVAGFVSHYKIFELVPGALLHGRGKAGEVVEIGLRLQSPAGRGFFYHDSTVANSAGEFTFRVPYATASKSGEVQPAGTYRIKAGKSGFTAEVNDADLLAGAVVPVKASN